MLVWQFLLKTRIFIKVPSIPFISICRRARYGSKGPRSAWLLSKGSQLFLSTVSMRLQFGKVRKKEIDEPTEGAETPSLLPPCWVFISPTRSTSLWLSWNHDVTSASCLGKRTGDTGPGLQGKVEGIYLKMPWNNTANIHILDLRNQASGCMVNRFGCWSSLLLLHRYLLPGETSIAVNCIRVLILNLLIGRYQLPHWLYCCNMFFIWHWIGLWCFVLFGGGGGV